MRGDDDNCLCLPILQNAPCRRGAPTSNQIESGSADPRASDAPRTAQRGWFRKRFIDWIDRHAVDEGRADTPYTGLSVFRISSKTVVRKEPTFGVTLGIVTQGRKSLRVDGRTLDIDPAHYLVVTREMQYDATVQPESELRPFLGVGITFPPELVAKALVALADGSD